MQMQKSAGSFSHADTEQSGSEHLQTAQLPPRETNSSFSNTRGALSTFKPVRRHNDFDDVAFLVHKME